MRRETFITVENIIRDFPRICDSLLRRERYIESMTSNSFITSPFVSKGEKLSKPELITDLKQKDVEYCELSSVVEVIGNALAALSDNLYRIIWLYYFNDMLDFEIADEICFSEQWCIKLRHKAIRQMVDPVLCVYLVVERWRRRERQNQLDHILPLLKNSRLPDISAPCLPSSHAPKYEKT